MKKFYQSEAFFFVFPVTSGILLYGMLLLVGCSGTISPNLVVAQVPSANHSDILDVIPSVGQHVTEHWRTRYNNLIAKYGNKFTVPVKFDEGIVKESEDHYFIDQHHVVDYFIPMLAMDKSK